MQSQQITAKEWSFSFSQKAILIFTCEHIYLMKILELMLLSEKNKNQGVSCFDVNKCLMFHKIFWKTTEGNKRNKNNPQFPVDFNFIEWAILAFFRKCKYHIFIPIKYNLFIVQKNVNSLREMTMIYNYKKKNFFSSLGGMRLNYQ